MATQNRGGRRSGAAPRGGRTGRARSGSIMFAAGRRRGAHRTIVMLMVVSVLGALLAVGVAASIGH